MRGSLVAEITATTPLNEVEEHLGRLTAEVSWLNRLSALSDEEDAALAQFLEDAWILIASMRRREAREAADSAPDRREQEELTGMVRIVMSDIGIVYQRLLV